MRIIINYSNDISVWTKIIDYKVKLLMHNISNLDVDDTTKKEIYECILELLKEKDEKFLI